jgi:hypothetical protein
VRAPGSKVTVAAAARLESFAEKSGSILTVPVNQSWGPLAEGCVPILVICIAQYLFNNDKKFMISSLLQKKVTTV